MSALPSAWRGATIGEVCELNPRDSGPTDPTALVSFVPMPAVSDATGTILDHTNRPFSEVSKGYTRFREEDVIFAKITPCMENGKIAVARGLSDGFACGSTEFHVLRSRGSVLPDYLWYYLRQRRFRAEAERHMAGAVGQRRVPVQYLRDAIVPLPPLDEQHRIVAKLDSLLARSRNAREELARIPRLVERYRQAVLAAAMRDANSREWPFVPLESLITEGPTNGYSPRAGENPNGTLSLKLTATTRAVLDLSDRSVKRLNEVIPPSSKYWLRSGDILIQRANSLEYVGVAAIYVGPEQTYIYPDLMMRVRVASPIVGRWIWRYLSSTEARRYFMSHATGTAGNMPKINGSTLRHILIPLPPADQLQVCLDKLDSALAAVDRVASQHAHATALLDRLEQAILAKAFRGELVPQESPQYTDIGRVRNQAPDESDAQLHATLR